MTPLQWIVGNDTGISSKTIWAVMMGAVEENPHPFQYDVPHDGDDFGRCYRLIKLFPEWKARLPEVAQRFPAWGPMVREWDTMEALFDEEIPNGLYGSAPRLYEFMDKFHDECREAIDHAMLLDRKKGE